MKDLNYFKKLLKTKRNIIITLDLIIALLNFIVIVIMLIFVKLSFNFSEIS